MNGFEGKEFDFSEAIRLLKGGKIYEKRRKRRGGGWAKEGKRERVGET